MVFYLKYRPRILSELDNQEVAARIMKFLQQGHVPHAFLFTGPKGTGKTSTARILAKSVNCPKAISDKNGLACGVCEVCVSIGRGDTLDVLEIDAASNRGIDEIRELRDKIKYLPAHLKYKIYIIDEVHMLTNEAFNALLKTLEEPPKHALFVLATTEMHKIPETILSRCVRIDFHKASETEIIASLKRIIKEEKLDVLDAALSEIAKLADGSFRDAHKLLEEAAMEHKKITVELIKKQAGLMDAAVVESFIEKLKGKQAKELLEIMQQLQNEGKNLRHFFYTLLKNLEDLLILSFSQKIEWDRPELVRAVDIFANAFTELKTAVIPSLPFELAVVEYCEDLSKIIEATPTVQPKTEITLDSPERTEILGKWHQLLEKLKPVNHSLVGVLRSCKPVKVENNTLVIEAAFKFHAERISEAKVKPLIMQAVKEVYGKDTMLEIVLKKR